VPRLTAVAVHACVCACVCSCFSNWESVKDPQSGDTYYWNSVTSETTWTRPVDTSVSLRASCGSLFHLPMLSTRLIVYFCDAHQSKHLRPSRSWTVSSTRSALGLVKLQLIQSLK
jgi:hypothetical protein